DGSQYSPVTGGKPPAIVSRHTRATNAGLHLRGFWHAELAHVEGDTLTLVEYEVNGACLTLALADAAAHALLPRDTGGIVHADRVKRAGCRALTAADAGLFVDRREVARGSDHRHAVFHH